tara:strand:- start:317698 stop:318216 length:519 start_codon:yes stop_codon:yes gene_type:complete
MSRERRHKAYLEFVSKLTSLVSKYSTEDLEEFIEISHSGYSHLIPMINAMSRIASASESNVRPISRRSKMVVEAGGGTHLFDLLRSKKLFPRNADLSEFAGRILPGIESHRFDKMSRGDIAGRIVEFVESMDMSRRKQLEQSMMDTLGKTEVVRAGDKKTFFTRWEEIIKGV